MALSIANDVFFKTLAVNAKVFAHIQELSTAGASKAALDVVVHQFSGNSLDARIQGSNDRVNWWSITGGNIAQITSVNREVKSDIVIGGWAYIHVEYEFAGDINETCVLTSSLATGE